MLIYYIGNRSTIVKVSIKDIQQSSSPLEQFRSGCKSVKTFQHYTVYVKKFVNEFLEDILKGEGYEARVNELISKAKSEPEWIKKIVIATIQQLRKKTELDPTDSDYIRPRTIYNTRNAIKKLLDMNEIALVWKKIDSMMPEDIQDNDSRGWTRQEIKKLLNHANARDSCAVLIASTSGIRLGAFDFLWGDVKPVYFNDGKFLFESYDVTESVEKEGKVVCAIIKVYGGAKESYCAFITPEAYDSVLEYSQTWIQKTALEPKDDDPFFVRNIRLKNQKLIPLSDSGLQTRIERLAKDAGLRNPLAQGKRRHNVPLMNGFRRFFNKSIKESDSRDSTLAQLIKKERMMGHKTGLIPLDANYFKTRVSELIEEYLQVVPNLTISEELRKQVKIEQQEKEISELKRSELEIQRLKSQQVDDKKQVLDMISKLVDDPKKFKEILKKSKNF